MKRPTLVLFDAHAILHRSYHALPDFSTKDGSPTGALYGLATLLLKTIEEFHPERMAACYDLPKPTFRDALYDAYKGKRQKTDDALIAQIDRSKSIFESLGIPVYSAEGFEADDVIGTIAEEAKKTYDVIIVTGDMDTLQLVQAKTVRVFTLKKGMNDTVIYDEEAVKKRFGFGPSLVPDYKGLRGDPSDNIIGIPGIGEKTATTLITAFGTIEQIYTALKKKGADTFFQKKGLSPRILALLRDHEEDAHFSKMLATIRRDAPLRFIKNQENHKELFDVNQAKQLFESLEFKSLVRRLDRVEGKDPDVPQEASQEGLLLVPELSPFLRKKIAIALWVLDSDKTSSSEEDIMDVPGKTAEEKLHFLEAEIHKTKLTRIYEEIELPLIPIIERAQQKGILVDRKHLAALSKEYHKILDQAAKEIYVHAGETFNINSPKQLGVILFDKLGLTAKGLRKTEGGARSTRESELDKLKDTHPIIEEILKFREYQKLLSTYVDAIPELLDEKGRLHTTLHQTGAATGRMSSSDPNLQNIPVREGVGERIRDAFMADAGSLFLAFDYSQIEMRVLALLSEDPGLIEIFQSGADVHTSVASRVFKVKPGEVTKDMRRRAKVINFGIIYGMGVSALQRSLGGGRSEAQEFYDDYLATFPRAAAYMESVIQGAKKLGYTTTLFGRRRYVREIKSHIPYLRAAGERAAMNAPIQGTAADLIKSAMIRADRALEEEGLRSRAELLLQVHDELIFEVKEEKETIQAVVRIVREAMEGVVPLPKVPILVTVKIGKRWGSLEEYTSQ